MTPDRKISPWILCWEPDRIHQGLTKIPWRGLSKVSRGISNSMEIIHLGPCSPQELHKDEESQNKAESATRAHHCSLWCCFDPFFGWTGREWKQAEPWCFALGCSMTPPCQFLSSRNDTALKCSFTLIYSLFKKLDSESEKNLSESKEKHRERQEDHFSVHHSTLLPLHPREHPNTSSTWQQQKAPSPWSARLKGFPHFPQPWISCARPVGGCFVGPVAANPARPPVPQLLGQVQCHAKLCLRNSTSNHIPVQKSHFSLGVVAAFSLSTFCWYQHPHLHQLHQ